MRASHLTTTIFWPLSSCFATVLARRPRRCPLPSMTTYNSSNTNQRLFIFSKGLLPCCTDIFASSSSGEAAVRTTGSVEDILHSHRFKRKISSERKSTALGYSLGMYVVGGCCRCGQVQRTQRSRMWFAGRRSLSEGGDTFVRAMIGRAPTLTSFRAQSRERSRRPAWPLRFWNSS